ncbi:hypothetical protein ABK040_000823 [Willaertia magna]
MLLCFGVCWQKKLKYLFKKITINNNSDGDFTVTTDNNNNALDNRDVLKNAYKLSKYARLCYESEEHIRKTFMAATDTPIIGTNATTTATLTINNDTNSNTNPDASTTNAANTVTLIANDDESDNNADNNEDTFTTNLTTTVTLTANENDSNNAVNDDGSNINNAGNNDNDNFKYYSVGNTHASLYKTDQFVIVSFRGTELFAMLIVQTWRHNEQQRSAEQQPIENQIYTLLGKDDEQEVIIETSITTNEPLSLINPDLITGVYLFGSPRCLNLNGALLYNQMLGDKTYRFVVGNDFASQLINSHKDKYYIPKLPYSLFSAIVKSYDKLANLGQEKLRPYYHIGQQFLFEKKWFNFGTSFLLKICGPATQENDYDKPATMTTFRNGRGADTISLRSRNVNLLLRFIRWLA